MTHLSSPFSVPIQVTKTYLPPLQDYHALLRDVWERNWVTNNGPLVRKLETRLRHRFEVSNCLYTSNGTISIQLALRGLNVTGSVITTPFSYVATTNSLLYENLTPIFVDVEPEYFTLDAEKVEEAIRPDTTAILATHVYGYPCNHEKLQSIADRYGLYLIYDAAHAFDIRLNGESVLAWGDASTLSFHATKVFHTIEGGAVICADAGANDRIEKLRSFGHVGRDYLQVGINGKNSELHAGIGLLNFSQLANNRAARKAISERYIELLKGRDIRCLSPSGYPGLDYNYAYFPIICASHEQREAIVERLNALNVFPRRYFEPSLNTLPFLRHENPAHCPVSEAAAKTVLCLPLYPDLAMKHVTIIGNAVKELAEVATV